MRYLTSEWIAAADRAVREAGSSAPGDRLVIDQHVAELASWRTTIDGGSSSVQAIDPASEPVDLAFSQTAETAVAIARGDLSAHEAFLLGRIEFRGDVDTLLAARAGLDWLRDALAPLAADTTWP